MKKALGVKLRFGPWVLAATLLLAGVACQPPAADREPAEAGPAQFPMSREAFDRRVSAPLLATCSHSQRAYRLPRHACVTLIKQRLHACRRTVRAPAMIESLEQFSAIGRLALECAKPYPFCNGIEVRTSEQVRQHCKPSELPLPSR